jgi:hypothetical protein
VLSDERVALRRGAGAYLYADTDGNACRIAAAKGQRDECGFFCYELSTRPPFSNCTSGPLRLFGKLHNEHCIMTEGRSASRERRSYERTFNSLRRCRKEITADVTKLHLRHAGRSARRGGYRQSVDKRLET